MPRTRQQANAEVSGSQIKEVKKERTTPAVPAPKSKKKQGLFELDISEFTEEKLQSLKWDELKQLAKQHNIAANGKRVFITWELLKIAEATTVIQQQQEPIHESDSAVGYVRTSPTKRRKTSTGAPTQEVAPTLVTPPNSSASFAGTSFRPSAPTAGEVTEEAPRTPRRRFGPSAGRGPLSGYHPTPRRPVFVPPRDEEAGVAKSPHTPNGQIGQYYEVDLSPPPAAEEDGHDELPHAPPPPPAERRPNFKPGDPRAAVWDKKHAKETEAQKTKEAEQAGKGKGKVRSQGTPEVKPMVRSDPLAQLKAMNGPSRKEIRSIRRDLTFCVNDAAAMPEEMDLDTRVAEEAIEELQQAARDVETSRSRLNQVGRMLGDIKRKRKRHD
ncbi:hypothetical protein BKA70DRAFT_1419072 [Coprinopsis sp. MPI-PUGE-AT-0042]|nr:hypothetical protein BKA70DRAFT_1419072 [Coprinopsis sp. MPI-PUGE-AT-0042]